MINEFSRTEMLIGTEGMNKLKNSTVVLFGVGGVGSHAAEALARCGLQTLTGRVLRSTVPWGSLRPGS